MDGIGGRRREDGSYVIICNYILIKSKKIKCKLIPKQLLKPQWSCCGAELD